MRRMATLSSTALFLLVLTAAPAVAYPTKPRPGAIAGHNGTALTGASISVEVVLLAGLVLIGMVALALGAIRKRRAAAS